MPKLKTKSSAKKRFKISAKGKVISAQAGKRHGMIKRTNSQIRKLRGTTTLSKVPILLICGKKEVDSNSVTIRRLDSNKQENMELKEFIKKYSALNKAPSI